MALPTKLRTTFLPEEVAFVAAQSEQVDVVPLLKMDRLRTISGLYGPFVPPEKCRVPLWLAVQLKRKRACRIVSPEWMSVERLEAFLHEETNNETFSSLPPKYMETAKIILDDAPDDVPSPDRVKTLLKDLREVRQSKMDVSVLDTGGVRVDNLSYLELNEIRPAYSAAFKRLLQLDPAEAQREAEAEMSNAFE